MTFAAVEPPGAELRVDDRTSEWTCLMFHDVLPGTSASGGGPERFAVPLASFETTLDVVARSAYLGCSLAAALTNRGRHRVAITFDDGTRSQFDHAVPALRARSMTATFYVTTRWVGKPGYMSWDELRQLVVWGMSVQSHTCSHPYLSELDAGAVRAELADSKSALDSELSQRTTEIALPGGDAPRRELRHLFAETGYEVVAGSRWGTNTDTVMRSPDRPVRRCTVRADTSPRSAQRLISGDPWLALARWPREEALARIRSTLGATRYSRWRRHLLDRLAGGQ